MATRKGIAQMTDDLLSDVRAEFQRGYFGRRELLFEIVERNPDVRESDALYLLAAVARHDDVERLVSVLELSQDPVIISRVIHCVGLTLSSRAIPFLWALRSRDSDPDCVADVEFALDIVASSHEPVISGEGGLKGDRYLYHGRPLFVGDITKEIVVESVASMKAERSAMVGYRSRMVSAITGSPCPIDSGVIVSEVLLQKLYEYVKAVASMQWVRGTKYYCRHEII